jgi:P27 family predicted phage terminase small subunit
MKKKAPAKLSKEAQIFWKKIMDEYEINDEAGFLILQTALESFDRMRAAQTMIDKDGMVFYDRFLKPKVHPLCTVERDSRSQLLAGLKALNLDIEPLKDRVGRPGGR